MTPPRAGDRFGGFRGRVMDFITLLAGLLSIIGAVLLSAGLLAPFVRYNEVDRSVDSVLYEGRYYIVCLAAAGLVAGSIAGLRTSIPELPREICNPLIIGVALAGSWSMVVLSRLNGLWASRSDAAVGDTIRGASGERLAVLGTVSLVAAGLLAAVALMLGDSLRVGPRLPRDASSIATLLLSITGCALVLSIRLPDQDVWHFLRDDYSWLIPWTAALAALPGLTSFLRPDRIFRALTVGWALGGLSICLFLYSQGQALQDSGAPGVTNSAATVTRLRAATLIGLIVVNAVALTKYGRGQEH
ncbi:hypothetical protein [Nocardia seriolae]|uniref:hypothetical protein n=2 Tax=Nocardia seriolae TaxID=37332 RepID=UPI00051A6F4F|nr:hypothetical protein [Nocardia seriolae]RLP24552.1 hypothetical protein D6158_33475 [Nocardia seriolae]WKY53558.1 hypothetical protein Q5P07_05250 [Nocardia seriolae]BAW09775.1 conserved hypothetical protein [Nocardia seriolae]